MTHAFLEISSISWHLKQNAALDAFPALDTSCRIGVGLQEAPEENRRRTYDIGEQEGDSRRVRREGQRCAARQLLNHNGRQEMLQQLRLGLPSARTPIET